jgi:hypothetical protein
MAPNRTWGKYYPGYPPRPGRYDAVVAEASLDGDLVTLGTREAYWTGREWEGLGSASPKTMLRVIGWVAPPDEGDR